MSKTNISEKKEQSPYDLKTLIQKYLEWTQAKNFSPETTKIRRYYLGFFANWCVESSIENIKEITSQILEAYHNHLCHHYSKQCKGILSLNSRSLYLRAVHLFFKWLVKKNYIINNPTNAIDLPKQPQKLPANVLTTEEAESIINLPDITIPRGLRNRAILETFYSTGIRCQELADLKIEHIDSERGTIVVQGKGRKERIVPIGKRALKWVEKYLQEARATLLGFEQDERYIFLAQRGKGLRGASINRIVSEYVKAANISKTGACHIFRHTMATCMLENGADIRYIQEILGHARLSSTQIYTRVGISKLKEMHERTLPNQTTPPPDEQEEIKLPHPGKAPVQSRSNKVQEFWENAEEELIHMGNKYFQWMQMSNYSPKTIKARRLDLKDFIEWCQEQEILNIQQISKQAIEKYQNHLANKKKNGKLLSAGRRSSILVAVSTFFGWLDKKKHILYNPAVDIDLPKCPKRLPRQIFTHEEVQRIMEQPNLKMANGIRDRTILETLYSTGMRREEIRQLQISQVNFSQNTVLVHGKGNKDRFVPIGENALLWIEKYLHEVRPLLHPCPEEATLFLNKYGKPFGTIGISEAINKYIKAANVSNSGGCHIFRHSMATRMLENGADIRYIQEILGHSSLSTTEIYTKVSISKLKEVHSQTHPAKMEPTKTPKIIAEIAESSGT